MSTIKSKLKVIAPMAVMVIGCALVIILSPDRAGARDQKASVMNKSMSDFLRQARCNVPLSQHNGGDSPYGCAENKRSFKTMLASFAR